MCTLAACGPRESDNGAAPSASPSGSTDNGGSSSAATPSASPSGSPDSGGNGGNGNTTTPSASPSGSPDSGGNGGNGNTATPDASPSGSPNTGDSGNTATPSTSPSGNPDDGGNGGGGSGLSGTPEEILARLVESLTDAGVEMPMSMPPMPVTAEQSQNSIGLSEADFERYVASAAQSMAALLTFAHQIIIIQGIDNNAAGQIKTLVSGKDGYDSQKWICVFPEKTVAIDSGAYVLLVASKREVADAAVEYFITTAGAAGEAVTFWEFME